MDAPLRLVVIMTFGITTIVWQLRYGLIREPIGFITNLVQSHQYNISSLSEAPNCKVRIIYNLNSTRLKVIQDERKSKIKEVSDMCSRNRTPVECNHVTLDADYHRDPPAMYNFLLVNDKHKVRDWLPKTTLKRFITVRNNSCGKVMFSQVSVCPRRGGIHSLGRRQTPPRADTALGRHPPSRRPLRREVPILLECILVLRIF